MMPVPYQLTLPVMLYVYDLLSTHHDLLQSYLYRILEVLGVCEPARLLMSMLTQAMLGIDSQQAYREIFPELKAFYAPHFLLYGTDTITASLGRISNSMAAWKVGLFQARLVRTQTPQLLEPPQDFGVGRVLDVDGLTLRSRSHTKEGAEVGYNTQAKGKTCWQLSGSWMGRMFVDAKLFAGHCNPKYFFRKAVKRAMALGLAFEVVRADSAYLTYENLRFLDSLSLGYAIGAPSTFDAVKKGKALFKRLARQKSARIQAVGKGVSLLDLGLVPLAKGVSTRVLIIRRIRRWKNNKTGQWKMRTYYYAIASNLDLSARKLYRFYHQRQGIEAGFRELRQQWQIGRLPVKNLKGNEFWIMGKLLAMTVFKLFQRDTLPSALHTIQRTTFFRRILQTGLDVTQNGALQVRPKRKYTWALRRLMARTRRLQEALSP
jgi:hypothetical protein